ncbi:hypothetical protein QWZ08_02160 [Ferruginibacter paludis]|uniref:hypothetical protein n=1 Tax=Ferruginibacter paludis TaxID=1310417 RepID=UPI0025B2D3CD|nr:hypothetical protein [Ferruginibacter paludis]MDN3654410.1 hypothetical protein [Ferruginibacter paludis]
MMNTIFIITNDYSLLDTGIDIDNMIISFVIDSVATIEKLTLKALHNSILFENKNIYFSLHFDVPDNNLDSFVETIQRQENMFMQLFFHPKYFNVAERPVVSLERKSWTTSPLEKIILSLDEQAVDQGFNGIRPVFFAGEDLLPGGEGNLIYNGDVSLQDFVNTYYDLLSKRYYASKYIGIKSKDFIQLTNALSDTETNLFKENPDLFNHLNQFCQLKNALVYLNENIQVAKEDLANQKAYLKIFKDQDESLNINEFYRNEYEILPLWYKQLGHLIKVMMGKRTWRSLFNNNVKKYKN